MIKGDQKARQYKRINNLHLPCQQSAWETDKAQWLRRFQADPFQSHYKNSGSEQKIPTARAEQYGDSHRLTWSFREKHLPVKKVIKYGLNPNALDTIWLSNWSGTYIACRKTDTHTREHATAHSPACPALTAAMPPLFACQEFWYTAQNWELSSPLSRNIT